MGSKARTVAYMGLLLALTVALSFAERLLPPLPMLPPGVNLGLANIVVMYCAFFLGGRWAFGIAAAKSLFVMLTRGPVAGLLSLSGGLLSVLVIVALLLIFGRRISYIAVSICGAVAHNLGQLCVAAALTTAGVFAYLPVLLVSGVVMGSATGATLKLLLPLFHKVFGPGQGHPHPPGK